MKKPSLAAILSVVFITYSGVTGAAYHQLDGEDCYNFSQSFIEQGKAIPSAMKYLPGDCIAGAMFASAIAKGVRQNKDLIDNRSFYNSQLNAYARNVVDMRAFMAAAKAQTEIINKEEPIK
ncbi:TPA: hypothetical protein PXR55_000249 [Yersinia enterocolitica]|nr:hypothetical protein [Yersinia enterocolitica]HDL7825615.1 hypothetical protein [Yersinia enterocolitica]HDL7833810.1 hypothetical protein [Yersinia enterocolitica]HDL7874716.1 hypothetical protein [Yersinia enterocolitica]HDL7887045.1 hypothetical protein [Yersinia enterocolitica]